MRRLGLALALVASAALAPPAAAVVIPGPNGPIVFTSGRDSGATVLSDNLAQIWFLRALGSSAQRLSPDSTSHHRHASWSPDRTKIAYARGAPGFAGPWDIWVQDLTQPISATNPKNVTNTPGNEDRPSWSPDGSRLAYAKFDGSEWDVVTKAADGTGGETIVAQTASAGPGNSGQFSRPQWSADGNSIFYGKIIAATPQDYDIYRAAADGSQNILGGAPVVTGATNDYQPALAPDGENMCFTRQATTSPPGKDIAVAPTTGTPPGTVLIAESGDEYECAWSPDDSHIAFVRGAFGAGEIREWDLETDGPSNDVTNQDTRFDGNPEWTRNPAPTCSNGTASVAHNGIVRIPLDCTDDPDPPGFQPNPPERQIATQPSNGTIGGIDDDNSVLYTPNAGFQGQDSFTFTGTDGTTTTAPATITINVAGPGADPAAVISNVLVSPRRWKRGPGLPRLSAAVGTRISWRLSEDAATTLTFQRARPGRRVGGRCLAPTRARRSRPRCRRFVSVRPALSFPGADEGQSSVRFQGRLRRRKVLKLGTYRVVVGATDSGGNRSAPVRSRTFKIVAR